MVSDYFTNEVKGEFPQKQITIGDAMENRKMYIDKATSELGKLKADIDLVESEPNKLSANLEIKRREAIKAVRQTQSAVEGRLERLRETSEEAWDDAREGFERARDDLGKAVQQVQERYSSDKTDGAK